LRAACRLKNWNFVLLAKKQLANRQFRIFTVLARLPLGLLFCCMLCAGCSDIVPGLNVRLHGDDNRQYHVEPDPATHGYQVSGGPAKLSYDIVPIRADTLADAWNDPAAGDVPAVLPAVLPSDVPAEYQIGPGDIIYVTVWDHPELTSPFQASVNDPSVPALQGRLVSADGTVFYPYVGQFKVQGMTVPQLRDFLTEHLRRVIAEPQVDVRVVAFRAKRIEVTGEVAHPGTVTLDDTPKGVLQAIAACGGLSGTASRRRAVLVRQGQPYELDLAGLLSGNRPAANPALEPGDVLHIPDQSGDEVFLLGAVNKQQPFPILEDSMPLIRALSDAEGLDSTRANQSGVLIFRLQRQPEGLHATVYTLDLSSPAGMLLASQFPLKPRDVVYVQATPLSQYYSVINQLLPSVESAFELSYITSLH
jgi:polysaccharide biosynthesis/export protein